MHTRTCDVDCAPACGWLPARCSNWSPWSAVSRSQPDRGPATRTNGWPSQGVHATHAHTADNPRSDEAIRIHCHPQAQCQQQGPPQAQCSLGVHVVEWLFGPAFRAALQPRTPDERCSTTRPRRRTGGHPHQRRRRRPQSNTSTSSVHSPCRSYTRTHPPTRPPLIPPHPPPPPPRLPRPRRRRPRRRRASTLPARLPLRWARMRRSPAPSG